MSRVTVTIHIDIPEGTVPDVDYSQEPPADLFPPFTADAPTYDRDAIAAPVVTVLPPAGAPICTVHNIAMKRYPAGVNKAGKPYNASWRCDVKDCPTRPLWDRDAAAV